MHLGMENICNFLKPFIFNNKIAMFKHFIGEHVT